MSRSRPTHKTLTAIALSLAVSISGCGSTESNDAPATTTTGAPDAATEPAASDLTADSQQSPESSGSQESATSTPQGPAQPLIGLGVEVTWNELVSSVADQSELACIRDAIDDEDLPDELLDGVMMDAATSIGAWPIWYREIVGIEVGDNHWPHQVWTCLEPDTAAALYISVRLEELARTTAGFAIADIDADCIKRLPARADLAAEVSKSLSTEFSFGDNEDGLAVLVALDAGTVDQALSACSPEAISVVIGSFLDETFDGGLTEHQHNCVLAEVMDSVADGTMDAAPLFSDDITDHYLDTQFLPVLEAAIETCIPQTETG